jgi:DNA-binding response OmpR family regulator
MDRMSLSANVSIQETGSSRNLDAAVFRLRKKIEQSTQRPAPIRTLHAIGYSITGQVSID